MFSGNFFQKVAVCLYLFTSCFLWISDAHAQSSRSNYVIIGAFKFEENAKERVAQAEASSVDALYEINPNRGLFYVYSLKTDDVGEASMALSDISSISGFEDSWIYSGSLGEEKEIVTTENLASVSDPEPEETQFLSEEPEEEIITVVEKEEPEEEPVVKRTRPLTKEELREEVLYDYTENDLIGNGNFNLGDITVFANLYSENNNSDVKGQIEIVDAERAKLLQNVQSGDFLNIVDPNNGTGKLSLIAEVFGYRKLQYDVNYYDPLADTTSENVEMIGDVIVYHFPLIRYNTGDIVTMYNVYFFKDAAIMMPESKFEVNSLVDMMKENPDYRIRIHGHTNGNRAGQIIYRGEDDDFFELTEEAKEKRGSSKKLSEARAELIKEYLVSQGISKDRLEVKAWGGKKMLYDEFSNMARYNVRVEIEILEDGSGT